MSMVILSPEDCHISGYVVNRFYGGGNVFIGSPEPQISSFEKKWDKWFRLPKYNTLAIDQQEISEKVTEMIQAIATYCSETGDLVDRFLIFPNLSYSHNFLTVTYDSLLETISANLVVPIAVLGGVYEYQVASPQMEIVILKDSKSGFEADISAAALISAVKRFQEIDVTNVSKVGTIKAFNFTDTVDDNWVDVFCERYLAKNGEAIGKSSEDAGEGV